MGKAKRLKEQKKMSQPQPTEEEKQKVAGALSTLKEITEKYKSGTDAVTPPDGENLNILPLPDTQEIQHNKIKWTWRVDEGYIDVEANLYTRGQSKGDYDVFIYQRTDATSTLDVSDCAKKLGQALVSASGYNNVWKQHAGTFLERELMTEEENEPTTANVTDPIGEEEFVRVIDKRKYRPEPVEFKEDVHEALPDGPVAQVIKPDGIESQEDVMSDAPVDE